MARAGVGVGVAERGGAGARSTSAGLAVLDLDDPGNSRVVAAYWYDVLLDTDTGRRAAPRRDGGAGTRGRRTASEQVGRSS